MPGTRGERVTAFLRKNKPLAYCDRCIKKNVGLDSIQQAHGITDDLVKTGLFQQGHGTCAVCRAALTVTLAR